jgi:hypothetical protein
LLGEQCLAELELVIEGYCYSVNERISIFIDHKEIYEGAIGGGFGG